MVAPTILFDIGYDLGAPDTADYWHIGDPTYGKIGTAKVGPDVLFTSLLTDRVLDFTTTRTSSRVVGPIVTYDAGSATITLLNDDGLLDPSVLSESPVMAVARIRAQLGDTVYPVLRGLITSWVPEHRQPTHSVIVVNVVDGFRVLSGDRRAVAAAGAGEDTGARLNRILNSANWSAADRDIATGDSTLQATTLAGDALQEAQDVMRAEAGEFYCNESGQMYFRNRHALLTDSRSTTSQATFGSNRAGGELPYVGKPGMSDDDEQLVNVLTASRAGGTVQTVTDEASRSRHLEHRHDESELLLQTDTDVRDWAGYVLHTDRLPEFRFTSLEIDPRVDEAALYPHVLGRRFGDRITVVRRPPASPWGSIVDSRQVYIRGISHTWSRPNKWHTTWQLQPVDKTSFWIIGHPLNGRVGRNALTY